MELNNENIKIGENDRKKKEPNNIVCCVLSSITLEPTMDYIMVSVTAHHCYSTRSNDSV